MDRFLIKPPARLPSQPSKPPALPAKRKFDDKEYDASKRVRTFQASWLGEFPWLAEDTVKDSGTMYCTPCRQWPAYADKHSPLFMGSGKFRKDPLYTHAKSSSHIACMNKSKSAKTATKETPIGKGILGMHAKHRERLIALSNTSYSIAKTSSPVQHQLLHCQDF